MKKEKQVRTYQRKSKSGKLITVKAHTAKYDAAEKAKEMPKKKGAGNELDELKKKKKGVQLELPFNEEDLEKKVEESVKEAETPKKETKKKVKKTIGTGTNGPEPRQKKTAAKKAEPKESVMSFTRADFREWYRGTGSEADKRVASILKKQLGRSGYKKLEDEAIDNYSSRGHLSMFKRINPEQNKKEHGAKQLDGALRANKELTKKKGAGSDPS